MLDNNEQVIVQRGKNKAYMLTPITDTDRYFADPTFKACLMESLFQAEQGKVTTMKKEDISKFCK